MPFLFQYAMFVILFFYLNAVYLISSRHMCLTLLHIEESRGEIKEKDEKTNTSLINFDFNNLI